MQYSVHGFKELERKLLMLGNETAGKALLPALRAGGNVIRDEARRRAPVKTGRLRRSIGVRINKRLEQGAEAVIRVSRRAWYGRLIEFGAEQHIIEPARERRTKQILQRLTRKRSAKREASDIADLALMNLDAAAGKGGLLANVSEGKIYGTRVRHPGVRAKPFLRPAIDVKGQEAINVLRDRLAANIRKLTR